MSRYVYVCPDCGSDEYIDETVINDGDPFIYCAECEREAVLRDNWEVDNAYDDMVWDEGQLAYL